jgi:hypothetical protein
VAKFISASQLAIGHEVQRLEMVIKDENFYVHKSERALKYKKLGLETFDFAAHPRPQCHLA